MLNSLAIKAINLLLKANPKTKDELQKYATKVIGLDLPFLSLQFIIAADGSLEPETSTTDCVITIPLSSASHAIHQDDVKTFKTLQITGDKVLAKNLLATLAAIETTKILYLQQNPLLNMFAAKLEQLIEQLVSYAKLVSHNAGLSTSQYLQYETNAIADKYQIEDFCTEVDNLRERCDLLAKRVERYTSSASNASATNNENATQESNR